MHSGILAVIFALLEDMENGHFDSGEDLVCAETFNCESLKFDQKAFDNRGRVVSILHFPPDLLEFIWR